MFWIFLQAQYQGLGHLSSVFKLLKAGALIKIKYKEVCSFMRVPTYACVGLTFHQPTEGNLPVTWV